MRAFAVVLLTVVSMVHGYGSGAPQGRCESMLPGHGTPQTDANPHSFSVSSTTYKAGGTVEVTISGTIKGLLLQARKTDGTTMPYGTFTVDSNDAVQLRECTNAGDAVTHSSPDDKTELKVTWTAPSSDMGDLQFVATVNEAQNTYWVGMKSETLTFSDDDAGSATQGVSATALLVVCAAALGVLKQLL